MKRIVTLLIAVVLLCAAGGYVRVHAQIGGTMLARQARPKAFVCVLLTGGGVQLTGGGVNLCE